MTKRQVGVSTSLSSTWSTVGRPARRADTSLAARAKAASSAAAHLSEYGRGLCMARTTKEVLLCSVYEPDLSPVSHNAPGSTLSRPPLLKLRQCSSCAAGGSAAQPAEGGSGPLCSCKPYTHQEAGRALRYWRLYTFFSLRHHSSGRWCCRTLRRLPCSGCRPSPALAAAPIVSPCRECDRCSCKAERCPLQHLHATPPLIKQGWTDPAFRSKALARGTAYYVNRCASKWTKANAAAACAAML